MALSATIKAGINATHTNVLDNGTATFQLNESQPVSLSDGVGANQADVMWSDTRTLAASASEDLDLAAGSLTNAFGVTATFARLKALYLVADSGNTNNVNITRPASNGVPIYLAAGDGEAVHPGAPLVKAWPGATAIPVTAGTGDLITIANSGAGTSVTYKIVLVGASA